MQSLSVIFFGDFSDERIAWNAAASHLGWSVHRVSDLNSLGHVSNGREVAAVFVDQRAQGTSDAIRLRSIRALLPEARIILCCPLRSMRDIDPETLGAFHVVARPLKLGELRTSMGFVSESWCRQKHAESRVAAA
jgi:DNA-binding NtrC family response regulator